MVKRLRLAGAAEETIRRFICEFGGDYWEEFYETLFGYEAKLIAREKWGRAIRGHERPEYAAWRDPIAAWLSRQYQRVRQRQGLPLEIQPATTQAVTMSAMGPAPAAAMRNEAATNVTPKSVGEAQQWLQAQRTAEVMTQHAEQIAQQAIKRREQMAASLPPPPAVPEVATPSSEDDGEAPELFPAGYLAPLRRTPQHHLRASPAVHHRRHPPDRVPGVAIRESRSVRRTGPGGPQQGRGRTGCAPPADPGTK